VELSVVDAFRFAGVVERPRRCASRTEARDLVPRLRGRRLARRIERRRVDVSLLQDAARGRIESWRAVLSGTEVGRVE